MKDCDFPLCEEAEVTDCQIPRLPWALVAFTVPQETPVAANMHVLIVNMCVLIRHLGLQ